MTVKEILQEIDASIERHIDDIAAMAEAVKEQFNAGERYSAAPITHVSQLPTDGELIAPDNLDAIYPNEQLSLQVLGVTPAEFTRWAATISRYDRGGVIGWFLTATVQIEGKKWERVINKGTAEFDFFNQDWHVVEEALEGLI